MRLLIDANLSPRVKVLSASRFEASHVADHGLLTAPDQQILEYAEQTQAVIVSADTDFTAMLALSGRAVPSLVLLRSADRLTPDEQAALLVANLPAVVEALEGGAVVTLPAGTSGCGRCRCDE